MWNVWEQNQAVTEQEMQPADNPEPRRSPQCECQCCAQPDFGKFYFFFYTAHCYAVLIIIVNLPQKLSLYYLGG